VNTRDVKTTRMQKLKGHEAVVTFGCLAEASVSTNLDRVVFLYLRPI